MTDRSGDALAAGVGQDVGADADAAVVSTDAAAAGTPGHTRHFPVPPRTASAASFRVVLGVGSQSAAESTVSGPGALLRCLYPVEVSLRIRSLWNSGVFL